MEAYANHARAVPEEGKDLQRGGTDKQLGPIRRQEQGQRQGRSNNHSVPLWQAFFFVHFSAGQFRPKACGALSFEGEKLSFRSKNTSFFHKGSFFL